MILSDILQYDLTGMDPKFQRKAIPFAIFEPNQVVEFSEPVYVNGLKLYRLDSNGNQVLLQAGTEYEANPDNLIDCRDNEATTHAKARFATMPYLPTTDTTLVDGKTYYVFDEYTGGFAAYTMSDDTEIPANVTLFEKATGNWTNVLIRRVFMRITPDTDTHGHYLDTVIYADYQAYHRSFANIARDADGPDYSPGLMRTVIETLDSLLAERYNKVVHNRDDLVVLSEDLTGVLEENHIHNERHVVDTSTDLFVIRPLSGSFYHFNETIEENNVPASPITDSDYYLRLEYDGADGSSKVLTEETGDGEGDYEVVGVNYAKTAISHPKGGVYEFIVLKKAFVGVVRLSYHAFGGEVTVGDIGELQRRIETVTSMVQGDGFLTAPKLADTQVIKQIKDRLDVIEDRLDNHANVEFLYQMNPEEDSWVNVASVFDHPWNDNAPMDYCGSAVMEFHIEQFTQVGEAESFLKPVSSMQVTLAFTYRPVETTASNGTVTITGITIDTRSLKITGPMADEDYLNYYTKRLLPKFRLISGMKKVVSNRTVQKYENGVTLQMSISGQNPYICRVTAKDKTPFKTEWDLIASSTAGSTRADAGTLTTLADGSTWDAESGWVSDVIACYGPEYMVFIGGIPVTFSDNGTIIHAIPEMTSDPGNHLNQEDNFKQDMQWALVTSNLRKHNFHPTSISQLGLIVYDRVAGKEIRVAITPDRFNDNGGTGVGEVIPAVYHKAIMADFMYCVEDLCSMRVSVYDHDTTEEEMEEIPPSYEQNVTIGLVANTGTASQDQCRFCITGIYFAN